MQLETIGLYTIRKKGRALTEITYTNLRRRLTVVLDQVGIEREVVIVRRRGKKSVAMIPADELAGWVETMHLLRSTRNSRRLFDALSRVPANRGRDKNSSLSSRQHSVARDPSTALLLR